MFVYAIDLTVIISRYGTNGSMYVLYTYQLQYMYEAVKIASKYYPDAGIFASSQTQLF